MSETLKIIQAIIATAIMLLLCNCSFGPPELDEHVWKTIRGRSTMRGDILIDSDGQEYPTVLMGNKRLMAQNLNYIIDNSWCYDNDTSNCAIYGRLYTWNAAKGACPVGWHLANDDEFEDINNLGFWSFFKSGGYRSDNGKFKGLYNGCGYWWSATKGKDHEPYWFTTGCVEIDKNYNEEYGLSVRCVQD